MRILNFQPVGIGPLLARFNVELSPDLTLLHWQLRRTAAGEYRCYPPQVFGPPERRVKSVAIATGLATEITLAATAIYNGGHEPREHSINAA